MAIDTRRITIGLILAFAFAANSTAQTESRATKTPGTWQLVASLEFDIRTDGFSFPNYRNRKGRFENDLAKDDLVRMFGARPACESGTTEANCVVKASARQWIEKMLLSMDIGHCEGLAVSSLRMNREKRFKGKAGPSDFQPRVSEVFGLGLDDRLENYIAYFWVTQTFEEVARVSDGWARRGPRAIVQEVIRGLNSGTETYTIGLEKFERGRAFDGHALVPFAVEFNGSTYRVHLYDSNHPGVVKHLFVENNDAQSWQYNSKADLKARPDYRGDLSTASLYLTPTSIREDRCFTPEFKRFGEKASNCGIASERVATSRFFPSPALVNARFHSQADDSADAELFLTDEGEMMLVDPNGRRLGYDPFEDEFVDEIPNAINDMMIGGLGLDAPHFIVPYDDRAPNSEYKIVFSGKYLDRGTENVMDFVFTAPGFTVGFENIRLDAGEVLLATITTDGERITFTSSSDGETPSVYFAFDGPLVDDASYIATAGGVALTAGKMLTFDFDLGAGKLHLTDDDGNQDKYDIELVRIAADGSEEIYTATDVDFARGRSDRYEMDFGDWDGNGDAICFRADDDGDGYQDEKCIEEPDDGG